VVEALVKVGERLGVTYRLSTPVSSIVLNSSNKKATGVLLSTGETLSADLIVINADLVYAHRELLPPSSRSKRLSKKPSSCSSISFYWSFSRTLPSLSTHNIFLADDYRESFDSIFDHQQMPAQPSFYVNVPSRVDPSAAPNDKDAVVVLVPVGHLLGPDGAGLDPQDWDAMVSKARDTVLSTIEARTGEQNLQAAINHEMTNTPQTWESEFNLDKGAILGLSHSFFNVLSFRPSTKHPSIKATYFVGASTHPGTGVPICLAGSKVTAEQILADYQTEIPWGKGAGFGGEGKNMGKGMGMGMGSMGIDRVEKPQLLPRLAGVFLVLLLAFYVLRWVGLWV
jgi:phytoene desaturase (3,4-didehydrolycopene-forming)